MTTLKAAVVPAKVLKNGKHRIRIAIGHKQETRYIVTRFEIDNTANFKGGQVVGVPDAAHVNAKLRGILNSYQDALDKMGQRNNLRDFMGQRIFGSADFPGW